MACNQTRNTRLAVVCETVEGVPVSPTSAAEFVPVQTGAFSLTPEVETLTNEEATGSLGPSKTIAGPLSPTASVSLYVRASGTEGVEPGLSPFLEAAFGTKVVATVEYDTVAASTTLLINVDAGEGVNFKVGQALLIKDSTNGYSIRPIESITGDVLTVAVSLATAPGTGVDLGKAITFCPLNTCDHKTLTVWDYRGNGGAVQVMSGSRVTNTGISISAGELINGTFDLEGLNWYFNPVDVVVGVNDDIDFTDDGGANVATIAAGLYQKPQDFAAAVETAMNAVSAETYTVTYSNTTGKYTIATSTSAVLSLDWFSGPNTATTAAALLGFDTIDETGALTYTSDSASDLSSPFDPDFSSFADPLVAKNQEMFIGDETSNVCFKAATAEFTLGTPATKKSDICAVTGISGSAISERTATLAVTALLNTYDADLVCRLLKNTDTRAVYNAGLKDGAGNWIPGFNWSLNMKTATVSSYSIEDLDGFVSVSFELTSFVKNGENEVFLSFV